VFLILKFGLPSWLAVYNVLLQALLLLEKSFFYVPACRLARDLNNALLRLLFLMFDIVGLLPNENETRKEAIT
jgi:hypothetical protein